MTRVDKHGSRKTGNSLSSDDGSLSWIQVPVCLTMIVRPPIPSHHVKDDVKMIPLLVVSASQVPVESINNRQEFLPLSPGRYRGVPPRCAPDFHGSGTGTNPTVQEDTNGKGLLVCPSGKSLPLVIRSSQWDTTFFVSIGECNA